VSEDSVTTAHTYIVRLYRRPRGGQQKLAGLVEVVAGGRQQSFGSFEELKAILSVPTRSPSRRATPSRDSAGGALSKRQPSKRR